MPRVFYFTADPPPITVNWRGNWGSTSGGAEVRLDSTKTTADVTKYTIQSVSGAETSAAETSYGLIKAVGGPLLAQNISGTMQIRIGVWESHELADLYFRLHVWLTQGDADIVRAKLINEYVEPLAFNNEWPTDPKGRDLILAAAITAADCMDDDRLVVEVGYLARNIDTTEYTGALYYGTDYYSNGCPDQVREP